MSIEIVNPENFVAKTLAQLTATVLASIEGRFDIELSDEMREQIQSELQAELEASLTKFASDEDEKPKSKAAKGKAVAKKAAPKAKISTKPPAKKAAAKAAAKTAPAKPKAKTAPKAKAKKPAPKDYSTMKVEDLKAELAARDLIKTGKKDDLIARLEAHDAGGEDAPKPKSAAKKAAPKKEVKPSGPVAQENAWGNSEEPDSGLIFVALPVGTGGRQVPVAVGIQNTEAPEDATGLASVLPLTDEMIEECNKQKWRFLSDEYMATLEELGHELYGELAEVRARGGEEETGEVAEEDAVEVVEDDAGEGDVEEEE